MTEMILLSDAQMARISPFFPLSHGIPRVDDRRVISGIINGHSPDTSSTMVANRPDDGISTTNTP